MATRNGDRRHRKYRLDDKIRIIKAAEEGLGYSALAKRFQIPRSTIIYILKRKNALLEEVKDKGLLVEIQPLAFEAVSFLKTKIIFPIKSVLGFERRKKTKEIQRGFQDRSDGICQIQLDIRGLEEVFYRPKKHPTMDAKKIGRKVKSRKDDFSIKR